MPRLTDEGQPFFAIGLSRHAGKILAGQVSQYPIDDRRVFDVPIAPAGTGIA